MGLMDRIKKVTGTNEGYEDPSYNDDYYGSFEEGGFDSVDGEGDIPPMTGGMNPGAGAGMGGGTMDSGMGAGSGPVGGNGGISLSGQNIRMKIVRPKSFADGTQIARFLLNKCTVFLNLENTNRETARRLIDFLSGVAFSIEGTIKKVANNAYVITPSNVDVGEPSTENPSAKRREREEHEAPASEAPSDFGDF